MKRPGQFHHYLGGVAAGVLLCVPLAAQDVELGLEVEEMVVTGSRIRSSDVVAPSPVTVLTAEAIFETGLVDLSEVLRTVPALNSSLTASQSALTGADNGVAELDLRGLGANRTLVLVNGRRHVSGVDGEATVDIQTIPIALIESTEVLTGGGSAIYGADAVSGVVNFILKDDFEGFDYRGNFSFDDNGEARGYFAAVTVGSNFADGRGNSVLSVEYSRQDSIIGSDRPFAGSGLFSIVPNTGLVPETFGVDPAFDNTFVPNQTLPISSQFGIINFQGSAFGGVLDFLDGETTFGGLPIVQVVDETGTLRPFDPGIFADGFNASGGDGIATEEPAERIIPDIQRVVVNGNARFRFADFITGFLESKFAFTSTEDALGVNGFNDDIPILLDNPFIPPALQDQIQQLQDQGIEPNLVLSRDTLDAAAQSETLSDRFTFRIVGGFEGDITENLSYSASFNYGRTEITETFTNVRLEDRFFASVDAVLDPATGEIVCRSDIDPDALPPVSPFPSSREGFLTFDPGDGQCVPTSLFGPDAITEEAADFIFQNVEETSELQQMVAQFVVTGTTADLFSLPAGPIGFAAGFEYREEQSEFNPNEPEILGLTFNSLTVAESPVSGGFDVYEGFAEVQIPVLEGLFLAEDLTISSAFRVSDYSTVGRAFAYNAGVSYRPIQDLLIRGTYNRAVRAPNVFELFSPEQPITIAADFDPCNPDQIDDGSEFRPGNCLELVGPGFNSTDFASAFVTGSAGGNPDVNEEVADTFTAGFVYTPSFLPGLTVLADYWNIQIDDAIATTDPETIIENCVDAPSLDNDFCPLVTRDPVNGNIIFFESGTTNIAALEAEGVDFLVRYGSSFEDLIDLNWGNVELEVGGQYLIARNDFEFQDFPDTIDTLAEEFTFPRWLVNLVLRWNKGPFSASYLVNFQSSQNLPGIENEEIAADPNFADQLFTGSASIHTVRGSYQLAEHLEFSVTLNNMFDREPFLATLTRPVGPIGRTVQIGIRGRF